MRALVVRTGPASQPSERKRGNTHMESHTLRNVDVCPWEAIRREEARVHADAVLGSHVSRRSDTLGERAARTESRTPLSTFSSASAASFLRWSSRKDRWPALPLALGADVGPDGTVGAWRLLILNGRPITAREVVASTAFLGACQVTRPWEWRQSATDAQGKAALVRSRMKRGAFRAPQPAAKAAGKNLYPAPRCKRPWQEVPRYMYGVPSEPSALEIALRIAPPVQRDT